MAKVSAAATGLPGSPISGTPRSLAECDRPPGLDREPPEIEPPELFDGSPDMVLLAGRNAARR